MGVWGLDDSNVWVWGRKGGEGIVHHFDARVTELPSPGKLLWMHGLAPELLVPVGERGLVTRWDGGRWMTNGGFVPTVLLMHSQREPGPPRVLVVDD